MSRGKLLSLEEARKGETPSATLGRFCKEHPSQADGSRFTRLLDAMCRGSLEGGETSDLAASANCIGTQTPPGTSEDDGG